MSLKKKDAESRDVQQDKVYGRKKKTVYTIK